MDKNILIALISVCVVIVLSICTLCLVLLFRKKEFPNKDEEVQKLEKQVNELKEENKRLSNKLTQVSTGEGEQTSLDNSVRVIVNKEEKEFEQALKDLNADSKKMYKELVKYFSSLTNTCIKRSKYHESFNYGKAKAVARLKITDNKLVVITNLGKLKIGGDLDPVEIKPSRLVVDEKTFEKVKHNILQSYMRLSNSTIDDTKNV